MTNAITQSPQRLPSGSLRELPKAPTGIHGLDEVTEGGLPRGRPTLVCGPAGCGKTLLSLEFLVRGITEFGENGVFLAFEETREDLIANVASLGFDLAQLEAERRTWLLDLLAAGKAAHKIRSRLPALAGRLPPAGEGR